MSALRSKHGRTTAAALSACLLVASIAFAQEKKEEEPFWAKGRPKSEAAMKMAPVARRRCRRLPTSCRS